MKINIRETFLNLTKRTYPHGTEHELEHLLPDMSKDFFGNYYIEIGDEYTCMFTSHLDTACGVNVKVNHVFDIDNDIVSTDGTSILGADCKAGVTIMLNMIENEIPGLYYFFLGEEVGCKGSKWLSKQIREGSMFKDNKIFKVISFDRKSTSSIITYQWDGRCASDAFADSLIKEFDKNGMSMNKDTGGVCTDSISFQDFIPECTNISVGYYSEHTSSERQDLSFLEKISECVTKIDWESLIVERDPSVSDYSNYGGFWGWEEEEEELYSSYSTSSTSSKTWDKDYSTFVIDSSTNTKTKVFVSVERIEYEKDIIREILITWGFERSEVEEIEWNGTHLTVSFDGSNLDSFSRNDLSYSDSRLSKVDSVDIKVKI